MIVWIRDLDRAVFYACRTTRAFILDNVSGLFIQSDPEVACFSFNSVDFCIG